MSFSISAQKDRNCKPVRKGEDQVDRSMQAPVGIYGDLKGIAGKAVQPTEWLEPKALDLSV